jgi:hypothetical protein
MGLAERKRSVRRFVRNHSVFFWGLVTIAIVLAPVLVSPHLRVAALEGIPILLEEVGRTLLRVETGITVLAFLALLSLACLFQWLCANCGWFLFGWRQWAYIISALMLFLTSLIFWVWGLVEFSQLDWSVLSGTEALLWVVGLSLLGILILASIRPSIWSVRILWGKDR